MKTAPAPFIAIEGMDGSGKTTLIRKLMQAFADQPVIFTREPGGTPLAEAVRDILLDGSLSEHASGRTQLLGFFYARSHHLGMICQQRKRGHAVITDRFDASTFAYQVYAQSKNQDERDTLDELFWILRNNIVQDDDAPTLYLYLDLPPAVAEMRRKGDTTQTGNHYDTKPIGFYKRQREGYEVFLDEISAYDESEIVRIDARQTPEQVFEQALETIRRHIRTR
jgi:dTMP kinase